MPKKNKHITGTIQRITEPKPKEFTKKKDGEKFTIYSIGIMLNNEEWYNIKANTPEKAEEHLTTEEGTITEGDEVTLYLEAEDKEGKYWKITSITLEKSEKEEKASDKEGVEGEQVELTEEKLEETESGTPKGKSHVPKALTPKDIQPNKEEKKKPEKDMGIVEDFKTKEADKYELGMAKNNAAIIISSLITAAGPDGKFSLEVWEDITEILYEAGKKIRK